MNILSDGPKDANLTILFAHGAGVGMDAPFMTDIAAGLAAATGARVVRFEFPYMAERRETGKRRPPDRAPVLLECFRELISEHGGQHFVLAGKSMGGRMATMLADEAGAGGVLVFGYPFHPPRQPEKRRVAHLETLKTPTLICQGTRDPFGPRGEVATFRLSPAITLHWLDDGDHDFKPRKASGRTHEQNKAEAVDASASFLKSLKL